MTVVAYDGRYLVADGRATRGTTLVSETTQKLEVMTIKGLGKAAVAICGVLNVKGPYLLHLKENGLFEPFEMHVGGDSEGPYELMGMILTTKGKCYEFSSDGGWFPVTGTNSIGSGMTVANHFLMTGFSALDAVKQAIATDVSCGGDISVFDSKTGKVSVLTKGSYEV